MWSNFRQMCRNSQAFLASQIHLSIEEDVVVGSIKNLQKMRNELLKKTEEQQHKREQQIASQHVNATDTQADIDYIVEEVDEPVEDEDPVLNDDYDDMYDDDFDNDDDTHDPDFKPSKNNANKYQFDLSKLNQIDFSEIFSPDDFAEAYDYLNADNDDELEKVIEHCATKNVALQTLRRKAIISRAKEQIAPKKHPQYKKKSKTEKLPKPSMFMCNICGNVYSKKPLFQYHMRMHSDVKPYQCE